MYALLLALSLLMQRPARTIDVVGRVVDANGLPLPGAVVTVEGAERFAVTDERGGFSLTEVPADGRLMASMPGFERKAWRVQPLERGPIVVVLAVAGVTESVSVIAPASPVTQSMTAVTPLDVVRTPGAQADLMRALGTQPGVATIDEGAGLFVRGGDVSEVLVLLDGVVLNHPYRYETPTGGFRGAVDPFLTQGASFATGGFSAQYGNALSAVIDLQAQGRPTDCQANLTAGLAGVSGSFASPLGAHAGVRVSANRSTPRLLFAVNPSPRQFDQLPGGWDLSSSITIEHPSFGHFRGLALAQRDHVGVQLEQDAFVGFLHSGTRHEFYSARWERSLSSGWSATASVGQDRYTKSTDVGVLAIEETERHTSGRAQVTGTLAHWAVLAGADVDRPLAIVNGRVPTRGGDLGGIGGASEFSVEHRDRRAGAYAVMSRTLGRLTPEFGVRSDWFDRSASRVVGPRASVRVALSDRHHVRFAAGRYAQSPAPSYFDAVRGADILTAMNARHLVVGYELGTAGEPTFLRVEAYHKRYTDLPVQSDADGFVSQGHGTARGLDVYVRRVWPRLDVKLSASLLDAARRWTSTEQRDRYVLPEGTWTPDFEIPYAMQAIATVQVTRAISAAGSWKRAAGRPFTPAIGAIESDRGFEPVWGAINSLRLPHYERVDLSISLLTPVGREMTAIVFASVDNLLARRNTFEMAYSADYSVRRPVVASAPRSFYVGVSFTR